MSKQYDVIVVGAGFAGATAARECASRGLKTLVLEARDRLGGRTHTVDLKSTNGPVDIGGTYFRWNQPHLWSEITRYGLTDDLVSGAAHIEHVAIFDDGELHWSLIPDANAPLSAADKRATELQALVLAQSKELFPVPFRPLEAGEALAAADSMTLQDRLDQLKLSPEDQKLAVQALGQGLGGDMVGKASYTNTLRGFALGEHNPEIHIKSLIGYRLSSGIVNLLERIIEDGEAEIRLSSPVSAIESDDKGARVTLATGEVLTAGAVVVATPASVWQHLGFTPQLPENWLRASRETMQSTGHAKVVAVIRGESRAFTIPMSLEPDHPFHQLSLHTSYFVSDDVQVVAGFIDELDEAFDLSRLQTTLEKLMPHVEVLEVAASSHTHADPYSGGGYGYLWPNQLTKYQPHNFRSHGRIFFAAAEIARLWNGYIDGAVETGLEAGRGVLNLLRKS